MNEAIELIALIEDASYAYAFRNNYFKYSFVDFLSIFCSFQCLYIIKFERDIVLSSLCDGLDKRGYII